MNWYFNNQPVFQPGGSAYISIVNLVQRTVNAVGGVGGEVKVNKRPQPQQLPSETEVPMPQLL